MKKFKLPLLLLAVCLIVCLIGVMAACDGEKATDGTQDNTDTSPSTPEEEKPQPTVEELSKAECENILQAKTQNLLPSVEVANIEGIQLYEEYYSYDDNYNPDFVLSSLFNFSEIAITKVNLNGGEVYGLCTLTANADGTVHSVYFVLKTNLFSLDRTSYEVLKEELAYLNAYYVSVYENSEDIPATDGFFDFNSLVAGETVPSPLTEEDYKAQCTEIINAKTLMGMNELKPSYVTISNLQINSINLDNGKMYVNANYKAGISIDRFYVLQTNLNELDSLSYKNLSEALSALKVESMDQQAMIEPEVSDEAYANLVNFVISNSIGWGPAGTYVEILNVNVFIPSPDGYSNFLTMVVLKNNSVYTINAKGPTGIGSQEDQIKRLLESPSTEVTFTSESFSDFNDIGK